MKRKDYAKGVKFMNVVTTFFEKRREKQIKYEKSVLRDLSIKELKERTNVFFNDSNFVLNHSVDSSFIETCYDVAIESYLLGAQFSKFGYFGESVEQVRNRSANEEKDLVDTLYHFLLYWGDDGETFYCDSLYSMCRQFVETWWFEGFVKGERRYKLRLH